MKNLKNNFFALVLLVFSVAHSSEVFSQSYSLDQPVMVPFYKGTIVNNTYIDIFWDISEINSVANNNRQDLALGLTQVGSAPIPPYNFSFTVGNWYFNEDDENFNEEDIDLRYISGGSGISGLLFAKLDNNATRKNLIVSRGDGRLQCFNNSGGIIVTSPAQTIYTTNGTVGSAGKFTTDDHEDIAVISGSNLKIYKSAGNGSLDTNAAYTLTSVSASKVLIAQVSSEVYPYSVINSSTSDRDEIIIRSGTNIKIYLNDNSNGTSTVTTISGLSIYRFQNSGY